MVNKLVIIIFSSLNGQIELIIEYYPRSTYAHNTTDKMSIYFPLCCFEDNKELFTFHSLCESSMQGRRRTLKMQSKQLPG
jgi:hypothetical protein